MPSLTGIENVTYLSDSLEVNKKMTCSEHHKCSAFHLSECTDGGDKTDSSKSPKECVVVDALRQPTPVDRATLAPFERSSWKEGNCEVTIENKETILSHIAEDGQHSEKTSNGHKSSEVAEKSEFEKPGMEVEEHDDLDRGWAFMVVIAAFIIMTIVGVVGPCFGILFADFLIENNATSATTAIIYSIENFTWSSTYMMEHLLEIFGWRVLGMAGGFLISLGLTASVFTPSVSFLFFFSMMTGFGIGLSCLVSYSVTSRYFKRKFGKAVGLMSAGLCVGGIIGPPMITQLQERYDYRTTTLIVAASSLLISLAATAFRPVRRKDSKVKKSTTPRPGFCKLIGQIICSISRNCLLLKCPKVIIIALGTSCTVGVYLNLFLLIPFLMESKGYTPEEMAWCMSISNLCNLVCRLVTSIFSDMAWFNPLITYIVLCFLLAVSTLVFGLVQNLMWIQVALGVSGSCIGSCLITFSMIVMKYMGLELYMPVNGITGLITGVWMICSGSLIGVIRDWSESYVVSVCVLGSTSFLGSILFLFMPVAVAYEKRKAVELRVKDAKVED